mmetsp:Transcript_109223/g.308056  ORF Transcript_109223/g.308056 Transcript_109223/m.308056 type:complete len:244 (-) Transcript_109223:2169-2900(-)
MGVGQGRNDYRGPTGRDARDHGSGDELCARALPVLRRGAEGVVALRRVRTRQLALWILVVHPRPGLLRPRPHQHRAACFLGGLRLRLHHYGAPCIVAPLRHRSGAQQTTRVVAWVPMARAVGRPARGHRYVLGVPCGVQHGRRDSGLHFPAHRVRDATGIPASSRRARSPRRLPELVAPRGDSRLPVVARFVEGAVILPARALPCRTSAEADARAVRPRSRDQGGERRSGDEFGQRRNETDGP